ncbi:hypothetical protein [Ideonella alba]|uniref:Tetratricopeptide repeat protein n=1 Tax=Ideonella alba TaxID=2824118 RepID=A0A941BJ97_9BURK|nr:hypothetical protein [Ideonella alba]MBQ0928849.1 hypothetical protein [Ideonella alba]
MSGPLSHRLMGAALGVLAALFTPAAPAAPRTPGDDAELLQQLPTRLGDAPPQRARLQAPRADPTRLPLALALAREALERARTRGDPSELGPAQAALAPWWGLAAPPPPVRLLRATLRQNQHDFSAALADLDALADAPAGATPPVPLAVRAQAEWTRATLHQVLGNWAQARTGCERLAAGVDQALGPATAWTGQVCLAELDSLQGRDPQAAQRTLASIARRAAGSGLDTAWLALVRAELAARLGSAEAGPLFREATAGSPGVYALAAHADWLLDQRREREVLRLLADRAEADALLLRLALAQQRLGDPAAAASIAQLQARFDAARLRQDNSHARELSRFELELRGRASVALELALGQWQLQKEPADALAVLRAAQAAGRPEAAAPVRAWARTQGFVDRRWPSERPRPGVGS